MVVLPRSDQALHPRACRKTSSLEPHASTGLRSHSITRRERQCIIRYNRAFGFCKSLVSYNHTHIALSHSAPLSQQSTSLLCRSPSSVSSLVCRLSRSVGHTVGGLSYCIPSPIKSLSCSVGNTVCGLSDHVPCAVYGLANGVCDAAKESSLTLSLVAAGEGLVESVCYTS